MMFDDIYLLLFDTI